MHTLLTNMTYIGVLCKTRNNKDSDHGALLLVVLATRYLEVMQQAGPPTYDPKFASFLSGGTGESTTHIGKPPISKPPHSKPPIRKPPIHKGDDEEPDKNPTISFYEEEESQLPDMGEDNETDEQSDGQGARASLTNWLTHMSHKRVRGGHD